MRLWAQARHLSNSLTGAHRRRDPRDQYLILRCCTVMMQQKAPRSRLMKVEGRLVRAPPAKDLIRGTSCINEAFRPVRCRRPRRPKAAGDVLISGNGVFLFFFYFYPVPWGPDFSFGRAAHQFPLIAGEDPFQPSVCSHALRQSFV